MDQKYSAPKWGENSKIRLHLTESKTEHTWLTENVWAQFTPFLCSTNQNFLKDIISPLYGLQLFCRYIPQNSMDKAQKSSKVAPKTLKFRFSKLH
jgi:hypothetical protein